MTVVDPFEGLPAHMLESIPLTVEVKVERRRTMTSMIEGEQKIMLDGVPTTETVTVQLERAGRPLTVADRATSWVPGERDGWREWPGPAWEPPAGAPRWDDITIADCEEEWE